MGAREHDRGPCAEGPELKLGVLPVVADRIFLLLLLFLRLVVELFDAQESSYLQVYLLVLACLKSLRHPCFASGQHRSQLANKRPLQLLIEPICQETETFLYLVFLLADSSPAAETCH